MKLHHIEIQLMSSSCHLLLCGCFCSRFCVIPRANERALCDWSCTGWRPQVEQQRLEVVVEQKRRQDEGAARKLSSTRSAGGTKVWWEDEALLWLIGQASGRVKASETVEGARGGKPRCSWADAWTESPARWPLYLGLFGVTRRACRFRKCLWRYA
jgi:hypothetical protein